jgi:predicted MPP superfamily phosphohydrolase
MKSYQFAIFFSVFFLIYGLVNYYIFIRGWQAIPAASTLRPYYLILFLFLSASFVAGRLLERAWLSPVSDILVWAGSFWLAAMLYFSLIIYALDIVRLVNHFIPFYPRFIAADYPRVKLIIALASVGLVSTILLAGHINALNPRVKTLDLTIHKSGNGRSTLNIVYASDIHLGTIVGRHRLDKIVEKINGLRPDIILLPGDIVDEDLRPVLRENIGESLCALKAPLGVFACTGNHEYIGGVEAAARYLIEHDIILLRDSTALIEDRFYLIGREDRDMQTFTGCKRKPVDELMNSVDKARPVIMMDHQPFSLERAAENGVDLQISGHTHHGQLWPLNLITNAIYEISWGYKLKEKTHIYVSTGVGSWGPPVRIGNRPEIVNIKLTFTG